MFNHYLSAWNLLPDGQPIVTHSSFLLPVRRWEEAATATATAMLKIATAPEEQAGAALMRWWDGEGAAKVLEHDGNAILMERLDGPQSLGELARSGRDDEATTILCTVAAQLHAPRRGPLPEVVPLSRWFRALHPAADRYGGVFSQAANAADALLATEQGVVPLHGDLHHGNVLDGGERGWLAIDPKGLIGERGFEFANIFCNPDLPVATTPGRLPRQVDVVAKVAGLDRTRLLHWILAYAGLSAAWTLEEGDEPIIALAVAKLAAAELGFPS